MLSIRHTSEGVSCRGLWGWSFVPVLGVTGSRPGVSAVCGMQEESWEISGSALSSPGKH